MADQSVDDRDYGQPVDAEILAAVIRILETFGSVTDTTINDLLNVNVTDVLERLTERGYLHVRDCPPTQFRGHDWSKPRRFYSLTDN